MKLNSTTGCFGVKLPSFCGNNNYSVLQNPPKDEFIRTKSNTESFNKSYEYAKSSCIEKLKEEVPYEYSVAIDKDGNILYETAGEEKSCKVLYNQLVPETTIVHGHPGDKFSPLSPIDIITFFAAPEIKTIAAVDKNGKTCSMTKPDGFKNFNEKSVIFQEINELFMKTHLDFIGISYETDESYIKECENELAAQIGINNEKDLLMMLYGNNKPQNPKEVFELLKFRGDIFGINIPEPYMKKFFEHSQEFADDSDEQIAILEQFLERVSKKYGTELQYE